MKRNNYRLFTTIALILLFFSHWMYYHAETGITSTDLIIATEFCAFFVFYEIAFLRLSPLLQITWGILCVFPLGYYYLRMQFEYQTDYFIPLTYLSVFLFYTSQYILLFEKKYEVTSSILVVLLHVFPVMYLSAIVFMVIVKKNAWETFFSSGVNYSTVIYLLILLLYIMIFVVGNPTIRKNKQKDYKEILRNDSIYFSIITLLETMILSRFYTATTIKHSVPLIWCLNLLLLYYQGNPHICRFANQMKRRVSIALTGSDKNIF